MDTLTAVGKRIPNRDSLAKVKGNAQYAKDLKIPGMLYGKILRSPFPHAKILGIETSQAEQLDGVKAVATFQDSNQAKFSISPTWADKLILEGEKVRYIGDEIAAVAAVDEIVAQEALELIRVEFEELPAVFDPKEAMQPDAPKIHESADGNVSKVIDMECGNVEEGFAQADDILEDVFCTHAQSHAPLEPHCCIAKFEPDGQLTVWTNTQAPHPLRQRFAAALGIETSKIHIITPSVGGGFGAKIDLDPSQAICAILSRKSGRPVRIAHTRQEEFISTRMRHPIRHELKFGVKKDGTLVAKQAKVIMDNGAYNSHGPAIMAYNNVMFSTLYRVENIKYEGRLVYTNKNWGGAFRGYGDPQATFAQESMMDMIARKLEMDPIELRLKNANKPNEVTANKVRISSCGLRESLLQARDEIQWNTKKKKKMKYRGLGVASMIYTGGGSIGSGFNYSGASLQLNADGSLHLLVGATDIGQGSNTILPQIAAEVLNVDPGSIRLTSSDTDTTLPCMGTFGSRVTFCAGSAVLEAAGNLKGLVLTEAAEMLGGDPEGFELRQGAVYAAKDPSSSLSLTELAFRVHFQKHKTLVGQGYYNGPEVTEDFDPVSYLGYPSPTMVFGTHIAEVEVDPDTGEVEVLGVVAAHDVGRAVNPLLVEGQIEGGIAQGVGWTMTEELLFENGRVLNPNFHDYKILTMRDVPSVTPIIIETIDPKGPFGAKGIGECAMVATAPAVINAIYDAVGVRIKELPATSEKIFQSLN